MTNRCHYCGIESDLEGAFFKVARSFSRSLRFACDPCHEKRRARRFHWRLWYWIGVTLIGITALFFPRWEGTGYVLLNCVLLKLFELLTIIPHELGHAFVGKLLGFRVFAVVVGSGKTLFKTQMMGFPLEVRTMPFIGGVTVSTPRSDKFFRLRYAFYVAAGPLVSVLIFLVVLFAMPRPIWPPWEIEDIQGNPLRLITLVLGQRLMPLQMILVANALLFIGNLIPKHFMSIQGRIQSDGMRLLNIPFMKRDEIGRRLTMYYVYESSVAWEDKRYEDARRWCEEGLANYPDNQLLISSRGNYLIHERSYEKARQIFYDQIQANIPDPVLNTWAHNSLAYADVMLGDPALLSEADACSKKAIDSLPWVAGFKGTRGQVLVELGQFDEGIKLLTESMREAEKATEKAENACHIALAEKRRGNLDESKRYIEMARSLDPDCFMLKRSTAD